ncbi:hypothetical protein EVAR_46918_1 [Eumeta japonica]|uniref:Uncharacterized protein n=1 Tax=Eumeta variegata TaxID=151549 RepID=A0A4C1XYA0_EUMVA|nr:hypothetical protein EVAR_46918_1 [Eumeta japonica]
MKRAFNSPIGSDIWNFWEPPAAAGPGATFAMPALGVATRLKVRGRAGTHDGRRPGARALSAGGHGAA